MFFKNKGGYQFFNRSPFHIVLLERSSRNSDMVELFIKHKAEVNLVDKKNVSPLHIAIEKFLKPEIFLHLLKVKKFFFFFF